jgi:hypothetical protein
MSLAARRSRVAPGLVVSLLVVLAACGSGLDQDTIVAQPAPEQEAPPPGPDATRVEGPRVNAADASFHVGYVPEGLAYAPEAAGTGAEQVEAGTVARSQAFLPDGVEPPFPAMPTEALFVRALAGIDAADYLAKAASSGGGDIPRRPVKVTHSTGIVERLPNNLVLMVEDSPTTVLVVTRFKPGWWDGVIHDADVAELIRVAEGIKAG